MSAAAVATLFSLLTFGPSKVDAWRSEELAVRSGTPARTFEELRAIALQYVGRPYVMGGVGSPGFDCSGFTCRVFAEAGYAIPRVSRDQANAGIDVPLDALRPGDLLFFVESPDSTRISHVGLYLGDRELIHASTGDGEVTVADLSSRWFRDRLTVARRVLTSTVSGTETSSISEPSPLPALPAPTRELVEHRPGELWPMLRRPARSLRPSYGPELSGARKTSIAVRSGLLTEEGVLGFLIAPEATLYLRSIALELALSLPIRFELHERVTVGEVRSAKDLTRYIRTLALGLRGADLELRLSQLGDLTLGHGLLVDKVAPGAQASGVPGFSIGRAPLSLFGNVRTSLGELTALADDAVDPTFAAIGVKSGTELFSGSIGLATDQSDRAVNAMSAEVEVEALHTKAWSLDVSAGASLLRALGQNGGLGIVRASAQHRFGSYRASSITLGARGGYLGRHTLDAVFNATYLAHREAHLNALSEARGRPFLGGELHLRAGRFVIGALFEDALGARRLGFDRRLDALLGFEGFPLWGTTLLDVRIAYASRGVFRGSPGDAASRSPLGSTAHALYSNAGVRLSSWMSVEAYAVYGERLEGGGGVSLRFEP